MPRSASLSRRAARAARAALAAGLLGLGAVLTTVGAAPASAHDQLLSTTPADGSQVASPSAVRLTFGEPVLDAGNGNRIVVIGSTGRVPGTLAVDGAQVSSTFDQPLPAGRYTVTWRVASDDGHPVSGTFRFTATGAPTGTATTSGAASSPAPTPVPSSSTDAHEDEDQAGGPGRVLLLVLIVGAALSAGTIVLAKRRQREAS